MLTQKLNFHEFFFEAFLFTAPTQREFSTFTPKKDPFLWDQMLILLFEIQKILTISSKTHHHVCDFNILEGMKCHGVPKDAIVDGSICVENEQVKIKASIIKVFKATGLYP